MLLPSQQFYLSAIPSILLFGATGLTGSHLILALRDSYPKLPVTVYVRNTSIDDYLTKIAGVARVVHGDFSEHAKIKAVAEEHDIVINMGSSGDDSGGAQEETGRIEVCTHSHEWNRKFYGYALD